MYKVATDFIVKLFGNTGAESVQSSGSDSDEERLVEIVVQNKIDSLAARLNDAIDESISVLSADNKQSNLRKITKEELAMFENTNVLNGNIKKLLTALKSIQPTSTESERVFSLSSNFCTKRRSNLSDKSLNSLTFLKGYFSRQK